MQMIALKQLRGQVVDLSVSARFICHYHRYGSLAPYIIDNEINNGGWYDELLTSIPEDAVIVDIGANVGLFSAYIGGPGRTYYCVEPCENHTIVLKDLMGSLGYVAHVYKGVIYNHHGMVNLVEAPENTTSNRVVEWGGLSVQALTLNAYFEILGLESVDFLKMDCEGSEKQIILEDPTIGEALKKCKLIFIETHTGDGYMTLSERDELVARVAGFGFKVVPGKRAGSFYFKNTMI